MGSRFMPSSRGLGYKSQVIVILTLSVMMVLPGVLSSSVPDGGRSEGSDRAVDPPAAKMMVIDSISTIVEVPPGGERILRVDHENNTLEPLDWNDPLEQVSGVAAEAVDAVEPWLKRDLAVQLVWMGRDGDRFARLIRDCTEDLYVDEIAFTVAHTPPEELRSMGSENVLLDNAQQLYDQDKHIPYANVVERTGEDGNYTTIQYTNYTGVQHEYPRDIYYWYVAHARVFWEVPAKVAGKSFWRKAYFEEITYEDSDTMKSYLTGCNNIIEGANASTIWMQMNMEFGYGTNPLQPVQVILERYGSCGQFSITTAASLKVAMIPARVAIYPASDHQWCEVWIDGHWMHVDASNDVAGNANVKEPELIRRTNSVNFNDAGVFERGWKPYMSATSTFRSDDVITNTIDISAPDPSFSFKETGLVERNGAEPHMYTETSTVHISVQDSGGDPIEGAYVGIYRVGHDIYNPGTPDYPHFANANYTNATGWTDIELGLQGYCGRCDESHYYAALVMSQYNKETNDFFAFDVAEENQEYTLQFTVTGDAPRQVEPTWGPIVTTFPPMDYNMSYEMDVWGRQRHVHGEYGQYEMFASRTSFDHLFPADVDVLLTNEAGMISYYGGGSPGVWSGARDVEHLEGMTALPHEEASYLILSNSDCSGSTKVVNLTVNLSALCEPRLDVDIPTDGSYHSTATTLEVNGTLWDYISIQTLEVSLDSGDTWVDITSDHSVVDRTYSSQLDVSTLPSGDYEVVVRATDTAGIWRQRRASIFLDADDPVVEIVGPFEGMILPRGEFVHVSVNASDNHILDSVRGRLVGHGWHSLTSGTTSVEIHEGYLETEGDVGPLVLEVVATDGVGRTTLVSVNVVLDPLSPILELSTPAPGSETVVGADDDVSVEGSVWDDYGIASLSYMVDEGQWTDVSDTIDVSKRFTFGLPVSEWEEGEHLVVLQVTDLAGHSHQREFTMTRDATPPVLLLDGFNDVYDDDDRVEISGTLTDDHGIDGLWLSVDDGTEMAVSLDVNGGFQYPLPSRSEAVGAHTVSLRSVDVLGNELTHTVGYTVMDVTDPLLTIDDPGQGAKVGRGTTVRLSGMASDNVGLLSLTMRIDSGEPVDIMASLDPVVDQFLQGIPTMGMDLGEFLLEVQAEDTAGNLVIRSLLLTLVDRTDPELELVLGPDLPEVEQGKEMIVPASFSDDVGVSKVEYRVDGWQWIPVLCLLPCQNWDVAVPSKGLSTGNHQLEVRVVDDAGNEVIKVTPFTVVAPPEQSSYGGWTIGGVAVAIIVAVVLALFIMNRSKASEIPGKAEPEDEAVEEEVLEEEAVVKEVDDGSPIEMDEEST